MLGVASATADGNDDRVTNHQPARVHRRRGHDCLEVEGGAAECVGVRYGKRTVAGGAGSGAEEEGFGGDVEAAVRHADGAEVDRQRDALIGRVGKAEEEAGEGGRDWIDGDLEGVADPGAGVRSLLCDGWGAAEPWASGGEGGQAGGVDGLVEAKGYGSTEAQDALADRVVNREKNSLRRVGLSNPTAFAHSLPTFGT